MRNLHLARAKRPVSLISPIASHARHRAPAFASPRAPSATHDGTIFPHHRPPPRARPASSRARPRPHRRVFATRRDARKPAHTRPRPRAVAARSRDDGRDETRTHRSTPRARVMMATDADPTDGLPPRGRSRGLPRRSRSATARPRGRHVGFGGIRAAGRPARRGGG